MEIYREDISPKWRYKKIYLHFSKIYLHFPEDLYHQDADISRYIFVFQEIYISIFRDISAVLEIYIYLCPKIYFISRKMNFFQKRYISEIQNLEKVISVRQGRYIFAKGKIYFFSEEIYLRPNFSCWTRLTEYPFTRSFQQSRITANEHLTFTTETSQRKLEFETRIRFCHFSYLSWNKGCGEMQNVCMESF